MDNLEGLRQVLPRVQSALAENKPVILTAPPGTGKTTLTAPALLDADWLAGRGIILLEPRRLAARAAAKQMARNIGENVGETVGYQIRLERCISKTTRIEVLTEGLLVQRLLSDPELPGVGLIIFDEFHERSLTADFSLALALDVRGALRPDLRLLLMSATIDAENIAEKLGATVVSAEAKAYPIETFYLARMSASPVHLQMSAAIERALRETDGGILAFLPGEAEIRRTQEVLRERGIEALPLYGALPREAQDAAVEPAEKRKVVLATSIAESSLTIRDISTVIDCGLMRVPRFSPGTGMTRLETLRITRDRADQRRGRAGRLRPGVCYRLWDEAADRGLSEHSRPEILDADLAPLRLQCAEWGANRIDALPWLTPPPQAAWEKATELIDALGRPRLTFLHPRLAHMVEKSGGDERALLLAAAIEERQETRFESDAERMLELAAHSRTLTRLAKQFAERLPRKMKRVPISAPAGRLLSWAYPDRVAKRRGAGRFLLVSGQGAVIDETSPLAAEEWLAIGETQDAAGDVKIRLAAPLLREWLEEDFAELIGAEERVVWDKQNDRVSATRRRKLGAIVLSEAPINLDISAAASAALCEGVRAHGVENLAWTREASELRARILFLRKFDETSWPDVSDSVLEATLEEWFAPFASGLRTWEQLQKVNIFSALGALLSAPQKARLAREAPEFWELPNSRRIKIHYDADSPFTEARIQELFGVTRAPILAAGRAACVVRLLSPARRPVQITADLAGFWKNSYPLVRKELRGRYPKHAWPENP